MTATLFRYPEAMKSEIEKSGMPYWSEGGDYRRLGDALKHAKDVANEKNFPIEVVYIGTTRVVYPDALTDKGYY